MLISEIDKYTKKKNRQQVTSSPIQSSEIPIQTSSEVVILNDSDKVFSHDSESRLSGLPCNNIQITNSEEEINARVKEATDIMHQKFIETTQETLNSIKQQKDAECKQIRLDMALKSRNLFEHTLKKYIRDGTIYNLIHLLKEKDGTLYPDTSLSTHKFVPR